MHSSRPLVVAIGGLVSLLTLCAVAEPAPATTQGTTSPVHVVGVYEAAAKQHLEAIDTSGRDVNWVRLCATLVAQADAKSPSPARRIWESMPETARKIAADPERVLKANNVAHEWPPNGALSTPGTDLRTLVHALQDALRRKDLIDTASFDNVTLEDAEAKRLWESRESLSLLERQVLHRRLFEAAFPDAVTPSPFTLQRATVPVRVMRTREPIILVLSSYESVRWVIKLDAGASVKRLIVGGYKAQHVDGLPDAPASSHTYADRLPNAPVNYFYAYKKDDEKYPAFIRAIRTLTGSEVTMFQGRYRGSDPKADVFVVRDPDAE